ncbi:hypothetical protein FB451DRAFT_1370627 [Mycena latifolia]|nr:hypothetical protein FB451DRAFT_1370627 [Mycena latifolia]
MRHPVAATMAIFTSLIIGAIVITIFSVTFRGPVTENDVFASAGEQDGFVFVGHIFHVDLDLRQMLVSWQPAGCGKYFARTEPSYALQNYGTGTNCGRPSVNVSLLINGVPSWSFDPSQDPFQGNQSIFTTAQRNFVSQLNISIYTYAFKFDQSSTHITYTDQQFIYPFDLYESRNTFIALTPSADGSTANATFLPILNVAAVDASETFVPSFNYMAPVANASVMFNGVEIDKAYVFMLTIRRSLLAQVFTLTIFLLNWGLVACVLFITLAAWVSKNRKLGDWALAVPVSILLTIPGLRALFVGNPPFGILFDAVGIFLQMIVVGICALALVLKVGAAKKSEGHWDGRKQYKMLNGHFTGYGDV